MQGPSGSRADEFEGIIDMLRFFAESRRLGVIDRVGLALSTDAIREALYEALRTIRALEQRRATFKLRLDDKEYTITCCDYDELEEGQVCPSSICGRVDDVISRDPGLQRYRNKTIWCARCPKIPDESELIKFFRVLEDPITGLKLAREVSALALSWRSRRGG